MKESNETNKLNQKQEKLDEFEKRAQRIMDRLEQADKIFEDLQIKNKKPDKATEVLQEIFEPIERGIKKLFNTSFSQVKKTIDEQERQQPLIPENFVRYLNSCSKEQLEAIMDEINKILKERGST